MRLSLLLSATISLTAITNFLPLKSVQASSFSEQEVNRDHFAVIAAPYRHGYNLVVVEQIPGQRKCWSENGSAPTIIEPLFLKFDSTNDCKRSFDSNSYSIRFHSQDYGMDYLPNIVKQDGELHLIGTPRDPSKPKLHIGRTYGLADGSLKITLDPQWRITKRIYEGNATNHIYLSGNSEQSERLVSHAVQPINTLYQQPSNYPVPTVSPHHGHPNPPVAQPSNYSQPVYQQPVYQQPVYQQPVYSVQTVTPQPMQPVYQQPVYSVQPVPPQPMQNVYPQPVYSVQPINNGYRQQ